MGTSPEIVRGKIKHDDEVVISNVEIHIEYTESRSGIQGWGGWFEVPVDTAIQADEYYLELEDGRSSRILVSFQRSPTHLSISFTGMGPLD